MLDAVVDSVAARVQALALTLAGRAVPVVKGKQPRFEQGATPNTQITVHPSQRPHGWRQLDTQSDLHSYHVTVAVWTPGNQDNTKNAAGYSAIDDAVVTTLDHAPSELAGLAGLYDVQAETGQYLDRGAFVKGWDVQQVLVNVEIVRAR